MIMKNDKKIYINKTTKMFGEEKRELFYFEFINDHCASNAAFTAMHRKY